MFTKYDLEELVSQYTQPDKEPKLEAIYMITVSDVYNAQENFRIRYGSTSALEEVLSDLKQLFHTDSNGVNSSIFSGRTQDTNEYYEKVLRHKCESSFPLSFSQKVQYQLTSLSQAARRMVFLLIREGSVFTGELNSFETPLSSTYEPSFKAIFNESLPKETVTELIWTGLLYERLISTRRHTYWKYIVPSFSWNIWPVLGELVSLPQIELREDTTEVKERVSTASSPVVEHEIFGIGFTGRRLEELVLAWVRENSEFTGHGEKVEESLWGIEFDVWARKGNEYIVFECKGPESTEGIPLKDLRDFWARVKELEEHVGEGYVEPWIVNTGSFTSDQESYIRERGIKRMEGPELIRKLIAWGILGIDLKGTPKFTQNKGVFFNQKICPETPEEAFELRI